MTSPDTEFINILGTTGSSDTTIIHRSASKSLPEILPVLGLSDIVVFPGMVAPLLVDTAQSIRLIDDVVAGKRFLVLVLQKKADDENPVPADLWAHGCAARVLKMLKFPDNTVRVLVEGLRRVHLTEGLDAAVGFLHRDRPGRPGLALDLMEELRPVLADRVVLSLINRQQVKASGFVEEPGGGIRMDEPTRKELVAAYQKRKQEEITHPFLQEKMTLGLVPLIQARLMARFLRGDSDAYPPFNWK